MRLSKEQREHVSAWLEKNGLVTKCPCCGKAPEWLLDGPQPEDALQHISMVQVICENCYFVLQFDPKVLSGFIPGRVAPG